MIKNIGQYLVCMRNDKIILSLNDHSFDCWVDADFCGMWDADTAEYNRITAQY